MKKIALIYVCITLAATLSPAESAAQRADHALASGQIAAERMKSYSDLAFEWMQGYLRIDTTNPPGNELRTATFLKKIFDQEGIENRVFEYSPGRADLWARVPHGGGSSRPPIILLSHMDVVTSDATHWKVPPFSGQIVDGAMYGRGAQDMKDEGLAQLLVMVMLKREKVALDRDVIFLAVADEEVGSTGTDWFIEHQRELLGNAEFLINEGGENILEAGRIKSIGVDVGEKVPYWLHVVAHGRAGHGSMPIADSAPNRLVAALNRILAYQTPFTVLPVVEEYLRHMAAHEPPARAEKFRNIRAALEDKSFQQEVTNDETLNYMLRDTISLTMMGGSAQTNVIPPEAWANLDVRLLPGEDPQKFLDSLRNAVNDPTVTIEPQSAEVRAANSSPAGTELYRTIEEVSAHYFPGAPVLPRLDSGYTESQRYRPLGINSYGFTPYVCTQEESDTEHGDNERIKVEEVRRGFRVLYDVITRVAVAGE